jgi:hypothetical protein
MNYISLLTLKQLIIGTIGSVTQGNWKKAANHIRRVLLTTGNMLSLKKKLLKSTAAVMSNSETETVLKLEPTATGLSNDHVKGYSCSENLLQKVVLLTIAALYMVDLGRKCDCVINYKYPASIDRVIQTIPPMLTARTSH